MQRTKENIGATTGRQLPAGDWTDQDLIPLGQVEDALSDGLALLRWWQGCEVSGGYDERFDVVRSYNRSDQSYGFFGRAPVRGELMPVMGIVDDLLYDEPKQASPFQVRDEFREFVLRYFMRVSSFTNPASAVNGWQPSPQDYFPGASWCPVKDVRREGFGYAQLYFKEMGTGEIGRFAEHEAYMCVDLRDFAFRYEWTICKVELFDFNLAFRPLGNSAPSLNLPLKEQNLLALSRDFVTARDDPAPDVLGEYGVGYSLLPSVVNDGPVRYGPGRFRAGFQLINFRVMANGKTRARLVFVVNRPDRLLEVPLDPVGWGLQLANTLSLGLASELFGPTFQILAGLRSSLITFDPIQAYIAFMDVLTGGSSITDMCISLSQLERYFLLQHFDQHYAMIVGSLRTWRHVSDWLDPASIPASFVTGVRS